MSEESAPKSPIKIKHHIPDIYWECHKRFGVNWDQGVVITYGDTVYCKYPITPDLEVHEATHIEQQTRMGAKEWWDKYFVDPKFRLEQETAAYMNQAKYIRENYSRPVRRSMYKKMANDMARMYGGMCTVDDALKIINAA